MTTRSRNRRRVPLPAQRAELGNRVSQAEFRCLACGHHADAGVNAARNILRAGLVLQEARQQAT